MKYIIRLSLIFAFITTLSCKVGSDDDPVQTPGIIGTWALVALNSDVAVDLDDDGTASMNLEEEEPCVLDSRVTFNEDGTLMNNPSFVLIPFGDLSINCVPSSFEGTWLLEGTQLTLTQDEQSTTGTIQLLGDQLTIFDVTQGIGPATVDAVYARQ